LLAAAIVIAQPALPGLRIEPIDAGTLLFVKNTARQPLSAFLIEMVDYPGSSFVFLRDELADGIAPGVERRFQVGNQLPGAVPDYVKLQAAIFADGTSAGMPAKVALLIDRRRAQLGTARDLIRRISVAADKTTALAEVRGLAVSLPGGSEARRGVIERALDALEKRSVEDALTNLRRMEAALAASKPPL
jgi:hypothetical protein